MPEYRKYQASLSNELMSTKDRVRNLIADANWAEEGRYKEVILMEILKSALPKNVLLGTGFIVGDNDVKSTQIDIIIYRSDYPEMFKKGDFVIVDKEAVLGIVEVKSKLKISKLEESLRKAHENGKLIGADKFNGIFAYETNIGLSRKMLQSSTEELFKKYSGYINNMLIGENHFMKYWDKGQPKENCDNPHITIYKIGNLSIGYFISNLVEAVLIKTIGKSLTETMNNFLYSIEGGKESMDKIDFEIRS